jgi:hypothetical protein
MKFVLVNDAPPRGSSTCRHCSNAIQAGYLRDLASKLPYCDYRCYRARKTKPIALAAPVRVPIRTEPLVQ